MRLESTGSEKTDTDSKAVQTMMTSGYAIMTPLKINTSKVTSLLGNDYKHHSFKEI